MKTNFSSETLEDMRCRLPEYLTKTGVELTRRGARLVGKCPMHDDSSPSFAVYGAKLENCGCFPCGHSGDIYATAIWLGRAASFPEAVADVAAVLGVHISSQPAGTATRPATAPQWAPKPAVPFELFAADRAKIHAARLAWSDAFHAGDPIIDRIAESLGFSRETLRLASWGRCGLGISTGWLCYIYPQGLKWRNPDPNGKSRFVWLCGKAQAPWRFEWIRPETQTVYLTEGESDCMSLIAAGLESDGTAVCVASPGTSFPQAWAPLFANKKVVLCFDADPPGQAAAAKVAAMLRGHASEVLTWKGPIQ